MAIAFGATLGAVGESAEATTIVLTTTAAVPSGGRIVLAVSWYNPQTASASGGGLTWTVDHRHDRAADTSYREAIISAHAPAGLASGTAITVTFTGSGAFARTVLAAYWTGIADTAPKDVSAGADGSLNPWSAGSVTTTNADDVLIGGCWIDFRTTTSTPDAGDSEVHDFQNTANNSTHTMTYRILSATGTVDLGGAWASDGAAWQGALVAYKAATGLVEFGYDVETRFPADSTTDTTTGNRTFTHAATADAKGATVMVQCTGNTSPVTGVLYGGVAMALIPEGAANDTTEAGRVEIYYLTGGSFPSGSQTVTLQGCTAAPKWVTCATVKAPSAVARHTSGIVNTTVGAAAQVSLTTTAPACSFAGIHHGAAAPSGAPVSGNTLLHSMDYGALSANTVRRTAVDAAGTFALGVTISSDDFCAAGVAFSEAETPGLTASIADTLSLVDAQGFISAVSRTLNEASLTLADSASLQAAFSAGLSDALGLVDTQQLQRALSAACVDVLVLSDTTAGELGRIVTLGDPVTLSDAVLRELALAAGLADAIPLSDSATSARAAVVSLGDVVVLGDVPDSSLGTSVTLADSLALSDGTLREGGKEAILADAASLSDLLGTASVVMQSVADPLSVADSLSRAVGLSVTDSLILVDAVALARQLTMADMLGLADQQLIDSSRSVNLASGLILSDGVTLAAGLSAVLTDSISPSDAAILASGIQWALNDSAALTDQASAVQALDRLVADVAGVVDGLSFAASLTIPDVLILADATTPEFAYFKLLADSAGAADEAFAVLGSAYVHHTPPLGGAYSGAAGGIVVALVSGGTITVISAQGIVATIDGEIIGGL